MTFVAQEAVSGSGIEKLVQNAQTAKTVEAAVAGHDSVVEPKFDGWRTVWVVDTNAAGEPVARFYTRSGNELTGRLPAIEAEIVGAVKTDGTPLFPAGTILDAEVVAFKTVAGNLTHERGAVASCLGSGLAKGKLRSAGLSLVVFDLIAHGEVDARQLPLSARRKALETLFAQDPTLSKVVLVPQLPATQEAHDVLVAQGYEGSMVKWLDARYGSGKRGAGWFKLKPQLTADVVVMGYKPGEGSFEGLVGAIEFGQYQDGELVYRGRCSGMDFAERCDFTENGDAYLGTVIEIAFFCVEPPSADYPLGAFRSPQFKYTRPDKSPESVIVHDG